MASFEPVSYAYVGHKYWIPSEGKYRLVTYLGICGHYDSYPIHEWQEKDGTHKSSYSVLFFEKSPESRYKVQYQEAWGEWFDLRTNLVRSAATRLAHASFDRFHDVRIVPHES
jgi:hypothetical protein